jgi:hypothetical protein
VPVPVVSDYCYLGLWFNNACNWSTHFEKISAKVHRVKGGLMPVWKSRLISVEVKRDILLTCIRPIVEYGREVWFPSTARQVQQIDKVQTDIIKSSGTLNTWRSGDDGRPVPLWSGRKREHCSIMFATITHIPSLHKILSNTQY